jgi:dTDP-4-amino-4,6-dideoxygalactose transaminase
LNQPYPDTVNLSGSAAYQLLSKSRLTHSFPAQLPRNAAGPLPVAESLAEEVVSLPIFPELTQPEIESVAAGILESFG